MQIDWQTHDQLVNNLAQYLGQRFRAPATVYRTHISSVIVCGKYAYKLKRPVKLPFVDFSTRALRRQDCWRELKLNQRTAPELYLDVVQITETPDHPRLNGPGRVLEWAVRMRRFKQTDLLSHLATTHRLGTAIALSLGKHHAKFISQLPALTQTQVAKHKPTHDWLLESLAEIQAAWPQLNQQVRAVAQWAHQHRHALGALIKRRQRQGYYRQVHGDLHLGNLVMLHGEVVAFDALEFNQALSQIDTVNDIAFTFMDLLAHARSDLAWAMINQWCENCGDYAGLKLLRYYTLYRAVVRAKVACLSNDDQALTRYWSLALKLIAPANTARLVLVSGLSGSGKSTVAREFVKRLAGIQLRADVIRKQRYRPWLDQPDKLYSKAATTATYRVLARLTDQLLAQNMTVIVDATFLAQAHIDLFLKLATTHGIELVHVWCEAPAATLKQRIVKRARKASDPSDATIAVLEAQIARLQQQPLTWPGHRHVLDTSGTKAQTTAAITKLAQKILKASPARQPELKPTQHD